MKFSKESDESKNTASELDLYYSVGGATIIDASITGTTLKLTLCDVYDFDQSYIDKLKDGQNAFGIMINAAGAAAMKDGKLIPYYSIFEVTIDLNSLGL